MVLGALRSLPNGQTVPLRGPISIQEPVQNAPVSEYIVSIQAGLVPGASLLRTNAWANELPVAAWEDAWPGPTDRVPRPTSAQSLEVVSGSADNAGGGTGIQRVRVRLLDSSYVESEVTVILNGTTPVAIPGGPWIRTNGMETLIAGSYGFAEGAEIDLRETGSGDVWSRIEVDSNQDRSAVRTVPDGKVALAYSWALEMRSRSTGDVLTGSFDYQPSGGAWLEIDASPDLDPDAFPRYERLLRGSVSIPSRADVRVSVRADANQQQALADYLLVVVDG